MHPEPNRPGSAPASDLVGKLAHPVKPELRPSPPMNPPGRPARDIPNRFQAFHARNWDAALASRASREHARGRHSG